MYEDLSDACAVIASHIIPQYPLLLCLMKPYLENALTTLQEQIFNYRQRMVVENAFGRLKGKVAMSNEEDRLPPTSNHYKYCYCMHHCT